MVSVTAGETAAENGSRNDRQRMRHWVIFAAAVVVLMLQGAGVFLYDAQQYWLGALGIVTGDGAPGGFFELRGALTAAVYVPAASLTRIMGEESAGFFVLLQNSVVIAWLGARLLPSFVRHLGYDGPRIVIASTFLVTVATYSFAPYPLIDLYALLFTVLAALLIVQRGPQHLALGGVCLGIATNLRPAYLIVAVVMLMSALLWERLNSLFLIVGVAVAYVPQMVVNHVKFGVLRASPVATDVLIELQASYASYVIRYDTILGAPTPQQFYCSPGMATRVAGHEPTTTAELAMALLRNMPESIIFALQKIAASLHWPIRTPYNVPELGLDALFALTITTVTVIGFLRILRSAFLERTAWRGGRQHAVFVLLAMAFGTVLTLVSSATESRFSLLLVIVGIVGCVQQGGGPRESSPSSRARLSLITGAVVVTVVAFGYWGLAHPAAPGNVNAEICSAT